MSTSSGFLNIVNKSNNFLNSGKASTCAHFIVNDLCVGLIRPDFLDELSKHDIFLLKTNENGIKEMHLQTKQATLEERSQRLDEVLREIRLVDCFVALRGWRDEAYGIRQTFASEDILHMERSATSLFGVIQYGTHMNGYLYDAAGKLHMWVAQRSLTKATFPGFLDNMCAGGLPAGMAIHECMKKEAYEEAGLVFGEGVTLKPAGTVSYFYEDERGLFPECQFVFDALLPSTFEPTNMDGEVHNFRLLPIDEVIRLIGTDQFKFNCSVVVLDFLIRHGIISPDNERHYAYLVEQMHVPLQKMFRERHFKFS